MKNSSEAAGLGAGVGIELVVALVLRGAAAVPGGVNTAGATLGGLAGKSSRADAGKSRSLDEQTGLWIIQNIKDHPRVLLRVLLRHWRGQGHQLPSASSIYRYLKAHGHDRRSLRAGRLEAGPQKAFEAPAPNDLWMVDFACGPTLRTAQGKALATHLCVILDDHGRLIPFGAYFAAADTAAFLHCLKEVVLRRGLPLKPCTDQGKPFVNHHVRIVCANLGVRQGPCPMIHPARVSWKVVHKVPMRE